MEKSEFNKQVGALVKKYRVEKGWSQAELASKMGNNFQNISRLERGEVSPTFFWMHQLAEVFEISLSDLSIQLKDSTKK